MITLNYNIKKINAGGLDLYAVNFKSCLNIGVKVFNTLQEALQFLTTDFDDCFIFKYDAAFDFSDIYISDNYKYYSMIRDRGVYCNYKNAGGPF